MTKFAIRYTIAFLLLIPAQAIIFNHLILFDVAVPLVFIYLILTLPVTIGTNLSTALGFAAGLMLDIFCDTPGVNALSCTLLAFARKPIFHLYVSMDDDLAGRSPSTRTMGHSAYMKFMVTMALIYCAMVFTIEAFQFFNFRLLILRIATSTIYTFILLYALDNLGLRQREARF
ncbi:MAG: rod shape-determining protein MreD [Muribaculaceae bacterium]|nr:rod shape-determining protein MreD [Muribaculaceae bacterium]MDE6134098.1 rod shape-determining protein MreD [Muribaculaceae bacterium]